MTALSKMMQLVCSNGIGLVAGETEASKSNLGISKERLELGNYAMVSNTKLYLEKNPHIVDPTIIYFTGAAHAKTKDGVPGIRELTGAVVLELHDEYRNLQDSSISISPKGVVVIKRNLTDLRKEVKEEESHISVKIPAASSFVERDAIRRASQELESNSRA